MKQSRHIRKYKTGRTRLVNPTVRKRFRVLIKPGAQLSPLTTITKQRVELEKPAAKEELSKAFKSPFFNASIRTEKKAEETLSILNNPIFTEKEKVHNKETIAKRSVNIPTLKVLAKDKNPEIKKIAERRLLI